MVLTTLFTAPRDVTTLPAAGLSTGACVRALDRGKPWNIHVDYKLRPGDVGCPPACSVSHAQPQPVAMTDPSHHAQEGCRPSSLRTSDIYGAAPTAYYMLARTRRQVNPVAPSYCWPDRPRCPSVPIPPQRPMRAPCSLSTDGIDGAKPQPLRVMRTRTAHDSLDVRDIMGKRWTPQNRTSTSLSTADIELAQPQFRTPLERGEDLCRVKRSPSLSGPRHGASVGGVLRANGWAKHKHVFGRFRNIRVVERPLLIKGDY